MEQRTDEWFAARCGKFTASRMGDLMAKTKSGPAASRKNLIATIVVERLTNEQPAGFTNAAMQHGIDTEPQARAAYEFHCDADVVEEGFTPHPAIECAGASPDGLVGNDGLIEIKCPNTAQHIETLRTGKIDQKYIYQMQLQMACTGRQWCDFVSFDPRMPEGMSLFIKRVERDEKTISELEAEILKADAEVTEIINELEKVAA